MSAVIDPRTGRQIGDHGTANQAIEYALDRLSDFIERGDFLRGWRQGDLEDWPEYYSWLAGQAS